MTTCPPETPSAEVGWPLSRMRETGLLWLINATVFHPRGFALGIADERWIIFGDGTEQWSFSTDPDVWPEGESPDDRFRAVEAFFNSLRPSVNAAWADEEQTDG